MQCQHEINSAIHAATVRSLPGESGYASAAYKACCLLVPFSGIRRGLNVFCRASALSVKPLHGAARANALCMIVRGRDWRPKVGEVIEGCQYEVLGVQLKGREVIKKWGSQKMNKWERDIPMGDIEVDKETSVVSAHPISSTSSAASTSVSNKTVDVIWKVASPYEHRAPTSWWGRLGDFLLYSYRFRAMPLENQVVERSHIEIHGVCRLPPGYVLCFVPPHMDVRPRGDATDKEVRLSSQFNALQILWSLAQTMIGSWTLWQARGHQLDRYGYAAFGLTVIPYVIASIINLLGSLVSRDYDDVYLVHSKIMDEAMARGGKVDGVVGTIEPPVDYTEDKMVGDEEHGRLGDLTYTFREYEDGEREGTLRAEKVERDDNLSTVSTAQSATEPTLIVPPPKPYLQCARTEKKRNKFATKWIMFWMTIGATWANPVADLPKEARDSSKPRYILSVPCHGTFRRIPKTYFESTFYVLSLVLLVSSVVAPYLIIYKLTGFQKRQSTNNQRVFMMHWLCLGQSYGLSVTEYERHMKKSTWGIILGIVFVLYGWAAVCGVYAVIQEMIEFGTCSTW
jgi:hypothetical protein